MSIITTSNNPKLLFPGIRAIFGNKYAELPKEYTDLVDISTSTRAYEEDVMQTGFNHIQVKPQGSSIQYQADTQGPVVRYPMITYGGGFIVTEEEREDNLYMDVVKRRLPGLVYAANQTKELVVANLYNKAFDSAAPTADGLSLCNTAHTHVTNNGTFSNRYDADISEAALETMLILTMNATDDQNLKIKLMPKSLHVSTTDWFNANRILKSVYRPGTQLNDINVIAAENALPMGIKVNHYFDTPKAWFIRTGGVQSGLNLFQRKELAISDDNDFDTKNHKYSVTERYAVGVSDVRALYGSAGD
ncbi:hypothetical protein UFOVP67_26 [uncultured Caudovirales phage]|uniref:Bacteriophage Mu, GpT n=1 Tax=uncultured Caudovirales phage TaxID=2100421 RepID=A0A6J5TAN3_9CAUD|nr:hypothetical protein UFOVP67_26 [uncultured Caudovirales phage]